MRFILTSWSDIDGHSFEEFDAADWDAATVRVADILSSYANEAALHQVSDRRCIDVLPIHAKRQAVREERERQAQEAKRLKKEAQDRAEYDRLKAKFEGGKQEGSTP